jgi:hypothetical protein
VRLILVAVAVLVMAAPASARVHARALDRPRMADLRAGPVLDRVAATPAPIGFWGGEYTTRTSERVRVFSSPSYAVDQAANQRWADFLAGLLHRTELASVTVYLATPAEVTRLCGGNPDVRGCYSAGRIIALGEDADVTAESVLAHEYGHHIAANRSNAPWPALGWGTKRWASYLDVCRLAKAKQIFPGAEAPLLYAFNPGEGFAEVYRLLNERRAGLPESPWQVVDEMYRPNARALALLQQDVLDPWVANQTVTLRGTFAARRPVRTLRVQTPVDGTLTATVSAGARVDVFSGKRRLAGGGASLQTTVCGARTLTFRVTGRGGGPREFALAISRP